MEQDIQSIHKKNRKESLKKIVYGLVWCLVFAWFSHGSISSAFDELKLIQYGQTAEGIVTGYFAKVDDEEKGIYINSFCDYIFFLPDGTALDGSSGVTRKFNRDGLVEIEYVSGNPKINRIKGEGNSTMLDWTWNKLSGLGLLALFVAPGIILIINGVKELRNPRILNNLENFN